MSDVLLFIDLINSQFTESQSVGVDGVARARVKSVHGDIVGGDNDVVYLCMYVCIHCVT